MGGPREPQRGRGSGPKSKRRPWVGGAADHPEGNSGIEAGVHGDLRGHGNLRGDGHLCGDGDLRGHGDLWGDGDLKREDDTESNIFSF